MNPALLAKCSCLTMTMMMTMMTLKAAFVGTPMIPVCHHHIGALSQTLALKESGRPVARGVAFKTETGHKFHVTGQRKHEEDGLKVCNITWRPKCVSQIDMYYDLSPLDYNLC